MHEDCKEIMFTHDQIVERCKEIGKQISEEYKGKKVLLIGLLKGSVPFFAELSQHIDLDVEFDFMSVSSYEGTETLTSKLKRILANEEMRADYEAPDSV